MKINLFDKVYAIELKLDKDSLSKIGYTTHEKMETRIASFRPIGIDLNADNVKVKYHETLLAKSVERLAKEIAIERGYPKTNNRNLGNGWTEWFGTPENPITQNDIWSCIMEAKKKLISEIENRGKE